MLISGVEPLPYTLLSLPRYARIFGIDPVHFAGVKPSLDAGIYFWTQKAGFAFNNPDTEVVR